MRTKDPNYYRYMAVLQLAVVVNAVRSKEECLEPHLSDYHRDCLSSVDGEYGYHCTCIPLTEKGIHIYDQCGVEVMTLQYAFVKERIEDGEFGDRESYRAWGYLRDYVIPETSEPKLAAFKRLFRDEIEQLENP